MISGSATIYKNKPDYFNTTTIKKYINLSKERQKYLHLMIKKTKRLFN